MGVVQTGKNGVRGRNGMRAQKRNNFVHSGLSGQLCVIVHICILGTKYPGVLMHCITHPVISNPYFLAKPSFRRSAIGQILFIGTMRNVKVFAKTNSEALLRSDDDI